jgi:hypothetical protein
MPDRAERKGEQKEAQFARDNLRGASTVGSSYIMVPAGTATTKLYQHLNGLLWYPGHALSECVNHQFETIGNAEL